MLVRDGMLAMHKRDRERENECMVAMKDDRLHSIVIYTHKTHATDWFYIFTL